MSQLLYPPSHLSPAEDAVFESGRSQQRERALHATAQGELAPLRIRRDREAEEEARILEALWDPRGIAADDEPVEPGRKQADEPKHPRHDQTSSKGAIFDFVFKCRFEVALALAKSGSQHGSCSGSCSFRGDVSGKLFCFVRLAASGNDIESRICTSDLYDQ